MGEEIVISVEFEHKKTGVRNKKSNPIEYRVRLEFWYDLIIFVLDDVFSTYTPEHLGTFRQKDLDLFMKTNAITYGEQKFFEEMRHAKYGENIIIKQVFVQNRYTSRVEKVNDDGTATFISKKGKPYNIMLSDRVKYEGIKPRDIAVISILTNGNWIVTAIDEVYDEEEERKELERQIKEFDEIYGGY